jgi:AIPR protein
VTTISNDQLVILKAKLAADFVQHLPALLKPSTVQAKNDEKNVCRALSGFAVAGLCDVAADTAAKSVVDDGDDFGLDAIFYHGATQTLYIVQAKLKDSSFVQEDALAFCQGLEKLIQQDFSGFNDNIQKRLQELEGALEDCTKIVPVVIYTGPAIVPHADKALSDCIEKLRDDDDRISDKYLVLDEQWIVMWLRAAQAHKRIDAKLVLHPWKSYDENRLTYFGFISLSALADLFITHGDALFTKNLRNPMGVMTDVADAVLDTLANRPSEFVHLNNGVTALCEAIDQKDNKKTGKRLSIRGLSVINGAQTISTVAHFKKKFPEKDISNANVLITLIKADQDGEFGKRVTRARNHQNAVTRQNFAALDDGQERLRRDLAALGLQYIYKAEDIFRTIFNDQCIHLEEAARALAMVQADPRYCVWLKKEPGQILDTGSDAYKSLFLPTLTGFKLANAVFLARYINSQMSAVERAADGRERLAYKHGVAPLGFVLSKSVLQSLEAPKLIDGAKLAAAMSIPFDTLRQRLWDAMQPMPRSALSVFRNQAYALPLLEKLLIDQYAVQNNARLVAERAKGNGAFGYPKPLFDYLCGCAPQIGNLT